MKRGIGLPRLAAVAWASWLGLMALLAAMLAARVRHPHFLPATALIVAMVGSWLALVVGSAWRLAVGPGRGRALAWLLIGSAPACFLAGHALFGLRAGLSRQIRHDYPLKLLLPLGESAMDLEARFRYPVRTRGQKVVMIAAPAAKAAEQVDAMDRHVRALEAKAGRTTEGPIHWVRGPLFGMEHRALFGLCLGSRPGEDAVDAEGLSTVDRHEVAHCVSACFLPVSAEPPSTLLEGYAEANSNQDPATLDLRLWDAHQGGRSMTLRELFGPDWYGRHMWPVYLHGGPLVHFLVREYGADRFFRLYATCRPDTFDDDCRRILGVGLDQLDRDFWAAIERGQQGESSSASRLRRLELGPGVARSDWDAFLDVYLAETARFLAPYAEARVVVERTHTFRDAKGVETTTPERIEVARSGPFRSYRSSAKDNDHAIVSRPVGSFDARRQQGEPWRVRRRNARWVAGSIDGLDPVAHGGAFLLDLSEELSNRVSVAGIIVTRLERFEESGRHLVRVRLEDARVKGGGSWRAFTIVADADDHYADRSAETEHGDNHKAAIAFSHDRRDGLPLFRSIRSTWAGTDGSTGTFRTEVIDRQFGPIPEDQFAEARFLDGPRDEIVDDIYAPTPTFADRYWLALALGAACLVVGIGIEAWGRGASLASRAPPVPSGAFELPKADGL